MNKEYKDIIDALLKITDYETIRNSPDYKALIMTYNDETLKRNK